jgi:hypothetical protein
MDGDDYDQPLDEIESNSADAVIPNKLGDCPVSVKTVDVDFSLYERALVPAAIFGIFGTYSRNHFAMGIKIRFRS